jgi:hypothetical protein
VDPDIVNSAEAIRILGFKSTSHFSWLVRSGALARLPLKVATGKRGRAPHVFRRADVERLAAARAEAEAERERERAAAAESPEINTLEAATILGVSVRSLRTLMSRRHGELVPLRASSFNPHSGQQTGRVWSRDAVVAFRDKLAAEVAAGGRRFLKRKVAAGGTAGRASDRTIDYAPPSITAEPPVRYGLLTARDTTELERRRAKLAAA